MKHSYEYEFKRIILKPLEKEDIEALRILRNQERKYFTTQQEIAIETQKKWFQSYLKKADDIMFKIAKKESPTEFIGAIALYNIDMKNKISEFGRVMVDKQKAPEKGIGTEATQAVCLFGFKILKLKKIIGEILKSNERIIKIDKRVGFHIIGERENLYDIEITPETICLETKHCLK